MVKRNLNDKLKVSNAEIIAFSYARKLHRSICYSTRLLINEFNAGGISGYMLEVGTQVYQIRWNNAK